MVFVSLVNNSLCAYKCSDKKVKQEKNFLFFFILWSIPAHKKAPTAPKRKEEMQFYDFSLCRLKKKLFLCNIE
jgi:hypothetical protein